MMRLGAVAAVLAIGITGCAGLSSGRAWIQVASNEAWTAPEDMSLQVGESAWSVTVDGGGGVATPLLNGTAEIRLFGVESCRLYASIRISPGSAYAIFFESAGSVSVEDWSGQSQPMGPGLPDREPVACDLPAPTP